MVCKINRGERLNTIVLEGLDGSGKTTFAERFLEENPNWVRETCLTEEFKDKDLDPQWPRTQELRAGISRIRSALRARKHNNVLLDRWSISSMVYATQRGNGTLAKPSAWIQRKLTKPDLVFYFNTDLDELLEREDTYNKDELLAQRFLYNQFMSYYGYEPMGKVVPHSDPNTEIEVYTTSNYHVNHKKHGTEEIREIFFHDGTYVDLDFDSE